MSCEDYSSGGSGAGNGPPLFGGQDAEYLKCIDDELIKLTGPVGTFYVHNRGKDIDPLYNEPTPWAYKGPFQLSMHLRYVEADDRSEEVDSERGWSDEHDGELHISRLEWEDKVGTESPRPKSSDVVFVNGEWFDLIRTGKNGYVLDTSEFVGYKMFLKRRSEFTPNRKIPAQPLP